jgi:sortase A
VRVFREEDPLLLNVGVIMMALALAFTVVGVAVSVALRSAPEQAVASETETTTKTSSKTSVEPLIRGESPYEPWVEKATTPPPTSEVSKNESEPEPSASEPKPEYKPVPQATPKVQSEPPPKPEPQAQPEPKAQPEPVSEQETLPEAEDDWQAPTEQELGVANRPRHYGLPPGAIMGLTIEAIGIYDAPVFDSDSQWALANGVAHVPETSLPWSATPQRNVFLAGHRMGYRGTWSRLIFYNLNKVSEGDEILLEDRGGRSYEYRVSEIFLANPEDSWVMGQVRGRDMVTLQTCTPIPTFEKRLIVRADRV